MSLNSVNIIGGLGGDPEVQYFESGTCKAKFSLAVSIYQKSEKQTHWFDVEAWGKTAETIANYCRKGSRVGVSGSLKTETWQDRQTGKNRSKVIINCSQVELIGGKKDAQQSDSYDEEF